MVRVRARSRQTDGYARVMRGMTGPVLRGPRREHPVKAERRQTLKDVAAWLDAEYRSLAAIEDHRASADGDFGALRLSGMARQTAELAALLREWASTGKAPPNRRVPMQVECEYARLLADAKGGPGEG